MIATAASAQTKWDMPTPYADGNFHTKNVIQFAADVDKATNGSLKITVHSAGSLFKHPEIKRAVRQGTAPIGEILESLAANEAPVYGLDSVPFLTTGYDSAHKLYMAQKPYLEKQLASEGLMLLYSVPWPPQGIYAKKEIKSVDDLKGMKFRTYNAMIGRIAALVGAIPTQIEVPDLPTAFATGRVDVMITSASTGVDTKAQDYLTNYIDTQAWQPRNIVFVNKQAFDKLSRRREEGGPRRRQGRRGARLETVGRGNDDQDRGAEGGRHQGDRRRRPELKAGLAKVGATITAEWEKAAGADGARHARGVSEITAPSPLAGEGWEGDHDCLHLR